MQDIDQQLPALVGVVIGAMATYAATALTERTRWRRGLQTRWDERRFEAYVNHALAVKQYVTLLRRVAGGLDLDSVAHPMPRDEGLPEIERAEVDRAGKFESMLLLGDNRTIQAAREWHRSAWRLANIVQGITPGGPGEWRQELSEVWAARARYYESAKLSLGMSAELDA